MNAHMDLLAESPVRKYDPKYKKKKYLKIGICSIVILFIIVIITARGENTPNVDVSADAADAADARMHGRTDGGDSNSPFRFSTGDQ